MRTSRLALIPVAAIAFAAPLSACATDQSTTVDSQEVVAEAEASPEAPAEETADAAPTSGAAPVRIVTTTTVLGSVATQIATCANPESTVSTLMPIGADPHDFAASSAQVAEMVTADMVIANGLGLESGLKDALENVAADGGVVIEIADRVDPIPFGEHGGDHAHGEEAKDDQAHSEDDHAHSEDDHAHSEEETDDHGHDHGSEDPHFWLDMNRMADAAQIIGDELAVNGGQAYADCGAQVADEIRAAEAEVRALLEAVPADKRVLVTDHEALGYLADAYGYEIAGTVIPAGTTLAEPSSADLAELVEVMQAEGVTVIFANTANPTALAEAVAGEVGGDVQVVSLFVESVGEPGSGAEDYVSMMRTNAELISSNLMS